MGSMFHSSINIKEFDANLQKLASSFDCGNEHINSFLRGTLSLDCGICKTFVWLNNENNDIIGFYSISCGVIEDNTQDGSNKIGSSLHINEFAINKPYQKTLYNPDIHAYISDVLLNDCIQRADYLRHEHIGFTFITLYSTEEGENLYYRNSFETIEEDMRIPINIDKEYSCKPMYYALDLDDMI